MNWILPLEPTVGLFLLNVALCATVVAGFGLLAARCRPFRATPLRHGILSAALYLVLLAPMLASVCLRCGFGLVGWPAEPVGSTHAGVGEPVRNRLPLSRYRQAPQPSVLAGVRAVGQEAEAPPVATAPPAHQVVSLGGRLAACLVGIWAAGMLWQAVVFLCGLRSVRRLRRSLLPLSDPRWLQLLDRAAQIVGLRQPPALAVSGLVATPVSLGVFHPVIVVPAALQAMLEEAEIEAILLHESAHVARRDHLTGLFQRLAGILFWWHPLVRRLRADLDEMKEELCDNCVVQSQGDGAAFARCLVRLAEIACCGKVFPTALGVMGGRRGLVRRVSNLLRKDRNAMTRMTRSMALALAVFALSAMGLAVTCMLKAAETPAQPGPKNPAPGQTDRPTPKAPEKPASPPRDEEVNRLIQQLSDDEFAKREKAAQELRKLGKAALPALKKAQTNPDLEVRRRAGKLIAAIDPPQTDSRPQQGGAGFFPVGPGGGFVFPAGGMQFQQAMATAVAQGGNGVRSITHRTGDRSVDINEGPAGIEMTVTETVKGKEVKKSYKAKNARDLEKNHPEASRIYKDATAAPAGLGGFRLPRIEMSIDENGQPKVKIDGKALPLPGATPPGQ